MELLCKKCNKFPLVNSSECESCRQKRKNLKKNTQNNNAKKKRKIKFLEQGLCSICGIYPLINGLECNDCCIKRREYQKTNYNTRKKENRLSHKIRSENFYSTGKCYRCGKNEPLNGKKKCKECFDLYKKYYTSIKREAYIKYGGFKCNCCGETTEEFLTLDHINNDGAEHRRELGITKKGNFSCSGGSGHALYLWLKRNNYPNNFQVLCMNCNWGKRMNGICPHKKH